MLWVTIFGLCQIFQHDNKHNSRQAHYTKYIGLKSDQSSVLSVIEHLAYTTYSKTVEEKSSWFSWFSFDYESFPMNYGLVNLWYESICKHGARKVFLQRIIFQFKHESFPLKSFAVYGIKIYCSASAKLICSNRTLKTIILKCV